MPKTLKAKKVVVSKLGTEPVNTSFVSYTSQPEIKVVANNVEFLGLNLDLGRQDLNDNFRAIQEKINEIIRKIN